MQRTCLVIEELLPLHAKERAAKAKEKAAVDDLINEVVMKELKTMTVFTLGDDVYKVVPKQCMNGTNGLS